MHNLSNLDKEDIIKDPSHQSNLDKEKMQKASDFDKNEIIND